MIRRHATTLRVLLGIVDATAALVTLMIVSSIRFGSERPLESLFFNAPNVLPLIAVYAFGWPLALWSQGLYRVRVRLTWRGELVDIVRAMLVFAAGLIALLFVTQVGEVSRSVLAVLFPSLAISAFIARRLIRALLGEMRRRGRNTRFVLVVGTNAFARRFAEMIDSHATLGLRVVGHLRVGGERSDLGRRVIGRLEDIEQILHNQVIDEVAICLPVSDWSRIDEVARLCEEEGKIVRIPMYFMLHTLSTGRMEEFGGIPIYSIVAGPDRALGLATKRILDIVGSAILLVITLPIAAVIAIAIRRESTDGVLFRQERVGEHGRRFELYKFRTMVRGAEEQLEDLAHRNEVSGPAFKLTDDPRVTPIGRLLRRTSLDELPQLWNVLRGEMSLVGPRPPLPAEVEGYDVWHRRRLSMKPGMTGLWQVRARHEANFDRWVETDLEYIDSWSLLLDLKIMARTIPAVINREGR